MKVNNGKARYMSLIVTAKVGGVVIGGYPKTYSILADLGTGYPAITQSQYAELSSAEFSNRITAFKAYVQVLEPGITFPASAEFDNATSCTIGV